MTTPNIGEQVYLGTFLVNTHVYGVVTPPDTPDQFSATFEIMGDQGTLMTNALVGPQGPAGTHAFALRLQLDNIDDPANLPQTLLNNSADIGKYWMIDDVDSEGNIIGSSAYIWYGTSWRRMMIGTPGPPGLVPIISPQVELLDPYGVEETSVQVSGTTLTPSWLMKLKVPPGPVGPSANLASSPDVDFITAEPESGQFLMFNGTKWVPADLLQTVPTAYSVPEAAYTAFSGLSQRATVGAFSVPPQPFPWVPIVWGTIVGVAGLELSTTPLTIGAEVRLGDPVSGTLVGRGFGNSFGEVNLLPHFSSPSLPSLALTPTNNLGRVPANHSNVGQGTVYINLYNDGVAGVYVFSPENAQLLVFCLPLTS